MRTSFATHKYSDILFRFAVELSVAGRIFTTRQLARHRLLSEYTNPQRRAREIIAPYRDRFEVLPWLPFNDYLWRLTDKEKRRLELKYNNVGASQHTGHWLALGDMWIALVFNGMRPTKWFTEGRAIGRFDVFAEIRHEPFMFEVQLTELKKHEWRDKWRRRSAWIRKERWREPEWAKQFCDCKPTVVLVTGHKMNLEVGVHVPGNVIVCNSIEMLPNVLGRHFRKRPLH